MAKLLRLAAVGTSAAAAAAQTAVELDGTPFTPGFSMLAHINTKGMTGTPVIKIQEASDAAFTTPVDLFATSGILTDDWVAEITPTLAYVRATVTTAGTAGAYQAWLEGGGSP